MKPALVTPATATPVARSRSQSGLRLAAAIYAVYTLLVSWPLVLHLRTRVIGLPQSDIWNSLWVHWFSVRHGLLAGAIPRHTQLLYFPEGLDCLPFLGNYLHPLLYAPLQLSWGLVPAFNAAGLVTLWANALALFALARQQTGSLIGSLVGGAVFGFSTFILAELQYGNPELAMVALLPLALWFTGRRAGSTWRNGLGAGMALAGQALLNWYFGIIAGFGLVLFAGLESIATRNWRALRTSAVGSAVSVLLCLPFALPLARALQAPEYRGRVAEAVPEHFSQAPGQRLNHSLDLLEPLHPAAARPVTTPWIGLGLALLSLLYRRRATFRWWSVAAFGYLLALGPYLKILDRSTFGTTGWRIPLPYAGLVTAVPLLERFRYLYRFAVLALLATAVLAAFGVAAIEARRPRVHHRLAVCLLLVLPVLELVPALPLTTVDAGVPATYRQIARDPRPVAVLELPVDEDFYVNSVPLYYQVAHGKPVIGGAPFPDLLPARAPWFDRSAAGSYVVRFPQSGPPPWPPEELRRMLRADGIGWVVFTLRHVPAEHVQPLTEGLGSLFGPDLDPAPDRTLHRLPD